MTHKHLDDAPFCPMCKAPMPETMRSFLAYAYDCEECGHSFEIRIWDSPASVKELSNARTREEAGE